MRTQAALLLFAGLCLSACGDAGSPLNEGPSPGTLVVSTSTEGDDPDQDGYVLTVDDVDSVDLHPTGTVEIPLAPGRHAVSLLGVAGQCSVVPGTALDVNVSPGSTTPVAFEVNCPATGARVTVTTTGLDIDPDGYRVVVDGSDQGAVAANGTVLTRLDPGSRMIDLTGLSPNCTIEGSGSRTVTIVHSEVAPIEFAVVCTATSPVLAFTGPDGHIYLRRATDGFFRVLTHDNLNSFDTDAAWSPDGDRIVFTRRDRDSSAIYVINVNGTNLVRLSPPGVHDGQPTWSPDGQRIAFVQGSSSVRDQIYIMNADGTNRVRLTTMRGGAISPSWSPDGRKIAFSAVSDSNTRDLHVMDVDGTHLAALTNDWVQDLDPAWSPDGSRIAFIRLADYGLGDFDSYLYLVNPDGTNLKWFDGPVNPKEPAWTPDGVWITVTRKLSGVWELWTIRVANGEGDGRRPFPGIAPSWWGP